MSQNQRVIEYGLEIAEKANKRAGVCAYAFDADSMRVRPCEVSLSQAGVSFGFSQAGGLLATYEGDRLERVQREKNGRLDTDRIALFLSNEHMHARLEADRAQMVAEAMGKAADALDRILGGLDLFAHAYLSPSAVAQADRALPAVRVGGEITMDELAYVVAAVREKLARDEAQALRLM